MHTRSGGQRRSALEGNEAETRKRTSERSRGKERLDLSGAVNPFDRFGLRGGSGVAGEAAKWRSGALISCPRSFYWALALEVFS